MARVQYTQYPQVGNDPQYYRDIIAKSMECIDYFSGKVPPTEKDWDYLYQMPQKFAEVFGGYDQAVRYAARYVVSAVEEMWTHNMSEIQMRRMGADIDKVDNSKVTSYADISGNKKVYDKI